MLVTTEKPLGLREISLRFAVKFLDVQPTNPIIDPGHAAKLPTKAVGTGTVVLQDQFSNEFARAGRFIRGIRFRCSQSAVWGRVDDNPKRRDQIDGCLC